MFKVANGEKQTDNKRNGQETSMHRDREHLAEPKQPSYGNQALLRMGRAGAMPPVAPLRPSQTARLQRKIACDSSISSLTGESEEFKGNKRLQAKLTIGASNDPLEYEADKVAEQVMRMPDPTLIADPLTPMRPSQGGLLHRRSSNQTTTETVPPIVVEVLRSSGQPLDAETRTFMEPRFEHDLGEVKVHADSKAADSAQVVNALAYTVGSHIVFGRNKYTPHTEKGKNLLAHELAHTIQQGFSKPFIDSVSAKVGGGQILQKAEPPEEGEDASLVQTPASPSGGAIPMSGSAPYPPVHFSFQFVGDPRTKSSVFTSPSSGSFSITASAVMSATPSRNISYWIQPITTGRFHFNGDEKEYTTGVGNQTNSWSDLDGDNVISLKFSSGNTNPNNAIVGQGDVA
ncbi:MAG: DUF4157 domain-containing protein [Methylococcaceae bacterium]|nr:DUF4157 domain-containing protein [Methylococcaceae bacterium]